MWRFANQAPARMYLIALPETQMMAAPASPAIHALPHSGSASLRCKPTIIRSHTAAKTQADQYAPLPNLAIMSCVTLGHGSRCMANERFA
jgi:hypothetical protein